MTTTRLPLPAAYMDLAYLRCANEAISTPELVEQFERLYGVKLASGGRDGMRAFNEFVHDCIYLRLPDEAIDALRV